MKSAALGQSTSQAEVTNVSPHGFWLFVGERGLFVPFKEFPWFREASVREITNVQLPSPHHLVLGAKAPRILAAPDAFPLPLGSECRRESPLRPDLPCSRSTLAPQNGIP